MVAKFILIGFALLAIVQASSICPTCGLGSGTDVCGCSVNVVRPVRPQRIQPAPPRIVCTKVPGVEKFRPIGDACSCGQNIVAPAYVPKQRCSSCQARLQQIQTLDSGLPLPYAIDYNQPIPAPLSLNNFEPEETGGEYDYLNGGIYSNNYASSNFATDDYYNNIYSPQQPLAPADAVSLTLAYGLQQQAAQSVPEERLSFGFREIPKDMPTIKQVKDIPEERLVTVDRQIVELKPNPRAYGCGAGSAIEQEAMEELLRFKQDELEAQDEALAVGQPYLSYRDIGYVPESIRSEPQFYINNAAPAVQYEELAAPRVVLNDGYIPGNVISVTSPEDYLEEANVSEAYGSDEDDVLGYGAYGLITSGSYGGTYGPDSFAANAGRSGVLLQKLSGSSCGCSQK